ncbi:MULTISPECIES: hypothetical protein [Streptomyces]|uniref:Uncharacterized protein n=2 Tax=Streptomyces TaxID=1883 RepID=A0ABV4SYW4_9ACTN
MALAPKVIQNQDSAAADTRLAAIAKALGYHDKTATRLVTEAGGTWSRYAPGGHERR